MPFARGDARKRKESGTGFWHILTAGAKYAQASSLAGGVVAQRSREKPELLNLRHKAKTTELSATLSQVQQLCLPVPFSPFLV